MDSHELTEWMAYYTVEPFGEYRDDLRIAAMTCTMANMWRGKNTKAFKLDDFVLKFDPPPKQSASEMKTVLKSLM